MSNNRNNVKLYNVLFPFWMLMMFPTAWLIVIPGNFIIDSLVLIISMAVLKITDKRQCYKLYLKFMPSECYLILSARHICCCC